MHWTLLSFLTSFLLIGQNGYGQTVKDTLKNSAINYFANCDFSNDGWTLFGIADWEHTPLKEEQYLIQENLGDFYTNDLTVLQQIKDNLTPQNKKPHGYGYPYTLELYKNDTLQKRVNVNMDNNFVESPNNSRYECAPDLIKNLVGKVKKIPMTEYVFPTLEEARKGYGILSQIDSVLIKPRDPYDWDWLIYDGSATVVYKDSTKTFDYKVAEKVIKQNIKKDCPQEKFLLISTSGHSIPKGMCEQNYRVISNKKLGTSLKTNKIVTPWTKFNNIKIWVYGLTSDQIRQITNGQ